MNVIASGSGSSSRRPRFTLTPRHEVQHLSGLAPELTPAQKASLTAVSVGFRGLGAEPTGETGFPVFPLVVYGAIIGLIVGTVHARRARRRG